MAETLKDRLVREIVLTGPLLGHASWHAYRASVLWDDPSEPTGPAPAPVAEAG